MLSDVGVPTHFPNENVRRHRVTSFFFRRYTNRQKVSESMVFATGGFVMTSGARAIDRTVIIFGLRPHTGGSFTFLLQKMVSSFRVFRTFDRVTRTAISFARALFVVLVIDVFTTITRAYNPNRLFYSLQTFFAPRVVGLLFRFFVPFPNGRKHFRLISSLYLFSGTRVKCGIVVSARSVVFHQVGYVLGLLFGVLYGGLN